MKKFKLDATTVVEPLPEDCDLIIKVNGPKDITLRVNKDRVFHVLASLDMILATVNSRGKQLISQWLVNQAMREDEISTARKLQQEQGLMGNGPKKDPVKRRRR